MLGPLSHARAAGRCILSIVGLRVRLQKGFARPESGHVNGLAQRDGRIQTQAASRLISTQAGGHWGATTAVRTFAFRFGGEGGSFCVAMALTGPALRFGPAAASLTKTDTLEVAIWFPGYRLRLPRSYLMEGHRDRCPGYIS